MRRKSPTTGELFEVGEQKYPYTGLAAATLEDTLIGRVCDFSTYFPKEMYVSICCVSMITSPFPFAPLYFGVLLIFIFTVAALTCLG